jgi:hypothetical protein
VEYLETDKFDWLAIVILPGGNENERHVFIIPRAVADAKARRNKPTTKSANQRYWRVDEVAIVFADFENNFRLNHSTSKALAASAS